MNNELCRRSERVKNVLIVSIAAPPYGTPESLQFSKYLKYLSGNNLNFYLVTAKLPKSNWGWRRVDPKYQSTLENFKQIVRVPIYFNKYIHGILNRLIPIWFQKPDNERLFVSGWKKVTRELRVTPDIIYSRSTPISSTVMALKLTHHYNVPWIMHLSDPWSVSPLLTRHGSVHDYHIQMEKACFDAATKVCLTSMEQINLYKPKYPQYENKFKWFPNVFDDQDILLHSLEFTKKITFVHTGNFYGNGRSPKPLLKAIKEVFREDPDILRDTMFLFAGFQDKSTTILMNEYSEFGVHYLGPLDVEETHRMHRSASVLVVIDLELPAQKAVYFPSKTLDYIIARKPIMGITTQGSTLHKIIHNNYGSCFQHNDVLEIKNYIIQMVRRYRSRDPLLLNPYKIDFKYSASRNSKRLMKLILETSNANNPCIDG